MGTGDVDLNLLRVLHALLEEGSVAKASERLHLSAPAVSRSLSRLRRALDDPLFVRSGRGLVPTPRAVELQGDVRSALDQATRVLSPAAGAFDPTQLQRTFSISAGDVIIAAFGLRLLEQVRRQAPGVDLIFLPDTNEAELLRSGQADLDIGSPNGLGNEIESDLLFSDRFVAACRAKHPLATGPLTASQFAEASHVVVSSTGVRRGAIDDALAASGLTRREVTVVPSFIVALHLIASSDSVGVLPNAVVRAFSDRVPVVAVELPFELPQLPVTQSWHRRNSNDPAHQWLRRTVRSVALQRGDADEESAVS